MLPDLQETKRFIEKAHQKRWNAARLRAMGPFADIKESPIHEGHRCAIIREDGSLDEMEFKQIKVSRTIKVAQVENWTEEEFYSHYEAMAAEMGLKQKAFTYEEMDKAIAKVGNKVVAHTVPNPELVLQAYEKMRIEFQNDGKHVPLTMICSPDAQKAWERAFEELDKDPELLSRFDEIIGRKRREWNERESSRKLVG